MAMGPPLPSLLANTILLNPPSLVVRVYLRELAGLGRQRLPHVADELAGQLVENLVSSISKASRCGVFILTLLIHQV
jgi:hypothetical protein